MLNERPNSPSYVGVPRSKTIVARLRRIVIDFIVSFDIRQLRFFKQGDQEREREYPRTNAVTGRRGRPAAGRGILVVAPQIPGASLNVEFAEKGLIGGAASVC